MQELGREEHVVFSEPEFGAVLVIELHLVSCISEVALGEYIPGAQ